MSRALAAIRIYNPSIGKFLSVDPLTKSYPMLTPYQFASNRPIDGVDLDGKEWDYYYKPTAQGKTKIVITANVEMSYDLKEIHTLGINIDDYKKAISSYFNEVLHNTSDNLSGKIDFKPKKSINVSIPHLIINSSAREKDDIIAGGTTGNFSSIKLLNRENKPYTPKDFASSAVHELLHTLRLEHPFEVTQAKDAELIHDGGNSYLTTENTDTHIFFNIMNYNMIDINGFNLGKINQQTGIENLTLGQVDFMLQEIDQQKKGAGKDGFIDPYYSNEAPGVKVEKKKP